jgi:type II secretory pathway pseudopilin PulG
MSTFGKKCLIALSLATVSMTASAYVIGNKAFTSRAQLINAAQLEYTTTQGYTIVDLDGVRIYDSMEGFGPAGYYSYFTCQNNSIRQYCGPTTGGYKY